ncbi:MULTISPECIES: TadE/TadG family type IV pilus assembly protein [unclassified Rhizobium]|uniref:TadE/TadG family type IV pilus assembly protein n=1 Tax=unclassified Rhizobium TaxID=2613769 RepID=UPI000CDF3D83|nr:MULTISPECIES: TadE/TadG family type IV pilus assembly protein [Rhizobium]AVA26505.1 Flp pilus assembly Tad-like protein [Rhizobium sp. NXC24]UWU24143.1 pilus assembly protein [Rhizobium tropici]
MAAKTAIPTEVSRSGMLIAERGLGSRTRAIPAWVLKRLCRDLLNEQHGTVAVDLAIILPVLIVMTFGLVDYSCALLQQTQVENAAQRGLQYALARGFDSSAMSNVITRNTGSAVISAAPVPSKFCGCPSSQGISITVCSDVCSDGSRAGTYVSASAAATYVPYVALPFIPASFALQSTATARLQ